MHRVVTDVRNGRESISLPVLQEHTTKTVLRSGNRIGRSKNLNNEVCGRIETMFISIMYVNNYICNVYVTAINIIQNRVLIIIRMY
jgi:hypothetical protein